MNPEFIDRLLSVACQLDMLPNCNQGMVADNLREIVKDALAANERRMRKIGSGLL